MLSHDRVWAAIDALAERYSMSASGLAKRAGLDFDGLQQVEASVRPMAGRAGPRPNRWPRSSTRPIPRSTNSWRWSRAGTAGDRPLPVQSSTVPLLGFAQAGAGGFFDDAGFPAARVGI